ncbi:MAG TPA: hypothetical protein VJA64_10080 [Desulfobaccales bacterium]|nr:hypothetical protein [Desulfobaccales bacterium]
MAFNSVTVKKLLLIAGLLIVLGQGLWQLPELQDHLFPVDHLELIISRARKVCSFNEGDLIAFEERLDYLTWFQAHDDPDQKVSTKWLRAFPFSETIRSLTTGFFWQLNIRLAHKSRMKVERRLRYLEPLLKSAAGDFRVGSAHDSLAIAPKPTLMDRSAKQIQQFEDQCMLYDSRLIELTKKLALIENNINKK